MSDPVADIERPRRRRRVLTVVLLLLLLAAAWWLWPRGATDTAPGSGRGGFRGMAGMAVPVRVAPVEQRSIRLTYSALGTVTAFNTVTVRSRVDGELQEILFKDGQKVQKGDLLARIDPRVYQVQLDQALGQQKQNQAQLQNAQRDLARYELLFKQNSIAKQQVDAQAALVQQYLGTRISDQAAVDSARLQLEFTEITAPITGRLGLRRVDEGNLISASSTDGLVVITQTQPISVLFTLPQSQLPPVLERFHGGDELRVELYDRAGVEQIAAGTLMSVDNEIDVATGTVKLKARMGNEDESLFPNQFVNVKLVVSTNPDAIAIPAVAVQHGSIGAFVYVVDEENKVHIQAVTPGTLDGDHVEVREGLQPGQRVVTEGVDRLKEGATVQVIQGG